MVNVKPLSISFAPGMSLLVPGTLCRLGRVGTGFVPTLPCLINSAVRGELVAIRGELVAVRGELVEP